MEQVRGLIAHRGVPSLVTENTIESFEKAVALGAKMVEFDLRRTKDGVIVVFHDKKIKGKKVGELDYSELKKLCGYDVPRYEELLNHLRGKVRLDIDIKEEGYEKEILEMTLKYFKREEFFVCSFSAEVLRRIKLMDKLIVTALLIDFKYWDIPRLFYTYYPREKIKYSMCDCIDSFHLYVNRKFVRLAKEDDKKVLVWTVNGKRKLKKFLNMEGIHAVITDEIQNGLEIAQIQNN